jgi:hypothetical protein
MFSVDKFQLSAHPWTLFAIFLIFSTTLTALVLVFAVFRPWWKRRNKRLEAEATHADLRNFVNTELNGGLKFTQNNLATQS